MRTCTQATFWCGWLTQIQSGAVLPLSSRCAAFAASVNCVDAAIDALMFLRKYQAGSHCYFSQGVQQSLCFLTSKKWNKRGKFMLLGIIAGASESRSSLRLLSQGLDCLHAASMAPIYCMDAVSKQYTLLRLTHAQPALTSWVHCHSALCFLCEMKAYQP